MRNLNFKDINGKIQKWIREYIKTANADGIILGLSGGIDSTVNAFLCSKAIGHNNVIGLSLPCKSNLDDYKDAKLIADLIGIKFYKVDLSSIYKLFLKKTKSFLKTNQNASANVKSRLRMVILYFFGQSMGNYLIAGTSNRTELAIGYFTKYGDGGVDFEPIGGLYKAEVRNLAEILGVPRKIIEKAPTAGLWSGQTDEKEIGISYDELDEIIYRIDHYLDISDLNPKNIKKTIKMMKSAEQKNKMPPIFKIK